MTVTIFRKCKRSNIIRTEEMRHQTLLIWQTGILFPAIAPEITATTPITRQTGTICLTIAQLTTAQAGRLISRTLLEIIAYLMEETHQFIEIIQITVVTGTAVFSVDLVTSEWLIYERLIYKWLFYECLFYEWLIYLWMLFLTFIHAY